MGLTCCYVVLSAVLFFRNDCAASASEQPSFPHVVTLTTTREIVKKYGASWQVLKGETRHFEDPLSTKPTVLLNVSLIVDHPIQTDKLQDLFTRGELRILEADQALTEKHLPQQLKQRLLRQRNDPKRNLQRQQQLNAEDQWIDSYSDCYPTVAQTFDILYEWANSTYPDWVRVDTIGPSYLKTVGDTAGWDIPVAIVDVPSDIPSEEKAPFMIVAGHHSRELSPPLTTLKWVEFLLESYGKDADVTWMLNRTAIHLIPIANPDGRVIVQNHMDWMYRKNAEPNGCNEWDYGTDLNRNYPMFWGENSGSQPNPCDYSYRGESALSAPESSAVFAYAAKIFDDDIKKGDADEATSRLAEACDEESAGLFFDVHSAGDFIYYPWGFLDDVWPPNNSSILTMSSKLAYFGKYRLWGPGSDDFLYTVSGDASDAMYGQYCINSYGFELGTQFYETCEDWERFVKPFAFQSFMYAAKTVYKSYKLPQGPDVLSIEASETTATLWTAQVVVSDDEMTRWESQAIAGVKVFVDIFPADPGTQDIEMIAEDGAFNDKTEVAKIGLNTTSWSPGRHIIYFQARDTAGFDGPVSAVWLYKEELAPLDKPASGAPTIPPTIDESELPRCPSPDTNFCVNENNYQDCLTLVEQGCVNILTKESCPLQFECQIDAQEEDQEEGNLSILLSDLATTQPAFDQDEDGLCPSPETNDCMGEVQYQECLNLVAEGCVELTATKSCPVQFDCKGYAAPDGIIGSTVNIFAVDPVMSAAAGKGSADSEIPILNTVTANVNSGAHGFTTLVSFGFLGLIWFLELI